MNKESVKLKLMLLGLVEDVEVASRGIEWFTTPGNDGLYIGLTDSYIRVYGQRFPYDQADQPIGIVTMTLNRLDENEERRTITEAPASGI